MQEHGSGNLVGTLVDNRYRVKSRLARGGMSTVYVATDQRLERDVALKVLHPHFVSDDTFLDRLAREAKAAAKLSHPHVVGVLDQGTDGQTAYLVMEYIKGHTLRDILNEKGALSPRLALALIDPVAEGLAAAHAAGLIHRDIKPENVLIADDGRIKVGDFGLARAVTTSTSTGTLIGTVAYLSPELVLGNPADARSDIYSVGIMLYEMLTGKQPFEGDVPIQVAYQHVHGTVGPPSVQVPGLASEVDELVQWCTASDPENRPVDGNALLSELRHIRTNLSDAELDLQPPAARKDNAVVAPGMKEPGARLEGTEVVIGAAEPTEIIARTNNPTTVLPAGMAPAVGIQGHGAAGSGADSILPQQPLSKREQRKLERDDERARNRAAATPVRSLREGNPRRRGALWIVVLVIAALLATGAGWFFGMGPGSPGTIPNVANKTVAEAQQLLGTAGFQSNTKDVFDDDVPSGLVVGSDPEAGLEIRKFQPVALFVSKGPQLFPLPGMTGRSLEEAKSALNEAEMALGPITEKFDETAPAGTILAQDPAAGTAVKRGTPVSFTVSKGPQPIPVPDVRGKSQDDAVKSLEAAGLKAVIATETVNDRTVPKGAVAAQTPASGTLTKGQSVTLTVSKGPKLVQVPSFIGKQADDARKALEKLGFQVRINNVLGGFFGTVRDQDPVNTEVPEGSVVTLTVV